MAFYVFANMERVNENHFALLTTYLPFFTRHIALTIFNAHRHEGKGNVNSMVLLTAKELILSDCLVKHRRRYICIGYCSIIILKSPNLPSGASIYKIILAL